MSRMLAATLVVCGFGLGGTVVYIAFASPSPPATLEECLMAGLNNDRPAEIQQVCNSIFESRQAADDEAAQAAVAARGTRMGEAMQQGTNLFWLRCPVGMAWDGRECRGEAKEIKREDILKACPNFYRPATRAEFIGLLDRCEDTGATCQCRSCADSLHCSSLFGNDTEVYWALPDPGDNSGPWFVQIEHGHIGEPDPNDINKLRCVRSGQ